MDQELETNLSNVIILKAFHNFTGDPGTYTQYDHTINAKQITQPYLLLGTVATQLNFVSTSINDASGGTGCKTVKFDYWTTSGTISEGNEVTLDGTTPVNVIATYADVAYIKRVYGHTFGTLGRNDGHILIQNNA